MANTVLKKEVEALKMRQVRLERLFYSLLGPEVSGEDEKIRLSYLHNIARISRRMDQGRWITTVHTKRELQKFLSIKNVCQ